MYQVPYIQYSEADSRLRYQGELTISFDNDFTVTFTNDLLVVPPMNVKADGSIYTNTSVSEILIQPTVGTNEDDYAILGRHFFQAAYLTVDIDAQTFTISEANPTTDSKMVALGGECSSPKVNAPPTKGQSANSSASATDTSEGGSLSTGGIVGVAIGGALIAALAASAIVLFVLRRRKSGDRRVENQDSSISLAPRDPKRAHDDDMLDYDAYEAMSGDVQEMQAKQDPRELAAHSRTLELSTARASRIRQMKWRDDMNSPIELE